MKVIKKTIIIAAIIFWAVAFPVLSDGIPAPRDSENEIIEFECTFENTEIEIGKEAVFQLKITNLTNDKLRLDYLDSDIFWTDSVFIAKNETTGYTERILLNSFETITLEVSAEVTESFNRYRTEDGYYADFCPEISFLIEGGNYEDDYYRQDCKNTFSLKIANLFDDPGYLKLEWLDETNSFYYEKTNYYYHEEKGFYYYGFNEYVMGIRNESELTIEKLGPGTVSVEKVHFYDSREKAEEIQDTVFFTYEYKYKIDNNYYIAYLDRELNTAVIEAPVINLEIKTDGTDESYVFSVINPNEYDIENFYFITDERMLEKEDDRYYKYGTLKSGETWQIFSPANERYTLFGVAAGYLMEGELHLWRVNTWFPDEINVSYTPAKFNDYGIICSYRFGTKFNEYFKMMMYSDDTPAPDVTIQLPVPTPENTDIITAAPSSSVIKRQNPYIAAFAVVGTFLTAAAIMIILAVKKTIENKRDEN